jgi:hypothetical protein
VQYGQLSDAEYRKHVREQFGFDPGVWTIRVCTLSNQRLGQVNAAGRPYAAPVKEAGAIVSALLTHSATLPEDFALQKN